MWLRTDVFATFTIGMFLGSLLAFHAFIVPSRYRKLVLDGHEPPAISSEVELRAQTTPMPHDAFFLKKPSDSTVATFFYFDSNILSEELFRLKPMWACSSQQQSTERRQKLIFLHVARSAGSTIRALLRAYARYCGVRIAIVNRCIDLCIHQLEKGETWRNSAYSYASSQDCILSLYANGTGDTHTSPPDLAARVSTRLIEELQVDILAGQLPIGSHEFWSTRGSNPVEVTYFVLMRTPMAKLVSEIVLHTNGTERLTIEEAVNLINRTVSSGLDQGRYHEKYSNYLITPRQKSWVEREAIEWSPERRVNLTLKNLYSSRIIVGIAERMPQSLQLLQHVTDETGALSNMFRFFTSSEKVATAAKFTSKNRTDAIVQRIIHDASVLPLVVEYLRYETIIYDAATTVHKMQYASIQKEKMTAETSPIIARA